MIGSAGSIACSSLNVFKLVDLIRALLLHPRARPGAGGGSAVCPGMCLQRLGVSCGVPVMVGVEMWTGLMPGNPGSFPRIQLPKLDEPDLGSSAGVGWRPWEQRPMDFSELGIRRKWFEPHNLSGT